MTDNINRKLTENARALLDKLIGETDCCEDGTIYAFNPDWMDTGEHKPNRPCTVCADLRALRDELCWHTQEDAIKHGWPQGYPINKNYTIQSLRKLLERMGEWDGFVLKLHEIVQDKVKDNNPTDWPAFMIEKHIYYADILTSNPLMPQAVNEYFVWRLG